MHPAQLGAGMLTADRLQACAPAADLKRTMQVLLACAHMTKGHLATHLTHCVLPVSAAGQPHQINDF